MNERIDYIKGRPGAGDKQCCKFHPGFFFIVLLSVFLFILCCAMFLLCLSSLFTFCMIHHIKIYFILTCPSFLLPCMHVWKIFLLLSFPWFVFLHTSPISESHFFSPRFLSCNTLSQSRTMRHSYSVQYQIKKNISGLKNQL